MSHLTTKDMEEIRKRVEDARKLPFTTWGVSILIEEDVPALLSEVERLREELSFIASVDLLKNAYDAEHVAVSVKSWALNVLDGINHDGK